MVSSSRPTSRLSYSEVARFGQPQESRHSAPPSIHQTSPKSPASSLGPQAPPLSAAPSASSTYLGTPSEITLLSYKEFTGGARNRDRRAILWRGARTQPQTPLLGVTNDSSISLPTDYEFRAELVDDGVGGAIARVPMFSTSILSKSPSLLSTGPSSPLSLPEGNGSPAVFASQNMLRSASLPIPNQLSYESFEAGLIAKERLAGSVELTGEAPPSKMSPAAKSIIPVKGFNSSSPLAPTSDRFRSISDSYILRPHYFGHSDEDELQDENPSFEVEDLSLSFSVGEDDLVCSSPSPRANGLDAIQLLGGIFGIVVDESEGEPPGSPDQTAIRDSEKENYEPGRPIGAVKTPTRPERLGDTGTTSTGHFPKPIPIVDDRSPLSDRSGQYLYSSTTESTMLDGTPTGRLLCPEVPTSQLPRNKTVSTSSTRQPSFTQLPLTASDATFVPPSTADASIFQDNSEEILYIPPRPLRAVSTQPEVNNSLNLILETRPGNAVVGEEVRLRRSGGSIGVIGEEVRNALARSTGSTSSTRSSKSSLGDLTIKPSSNGAREIGEMDLRSQSVPEAAGRRLGHPSAEPAYNPLATHTPGLKPNDFESSDHDTNSPGRPIHLHLSADDSGQHLLPPGLPPPPRKGFIPPSSELEPARAPSSLRRVPIRRVSQEPASSLPVIAEVSVSLSSPPISPSVEASPNQQPTQPSDAAPRSRSNPWSFAQEESNAVTVPSLQLSPLLPVQVNFHNHVVSSDDLKQLPADEQRDLRLRDVLDHWEDIPNWISAEDWVKTASSGTMDLKSVYDLVDRQEMETILDFAHHARFLMDLDDSTQPTLTLKSVFNPSRIPFQHSVTQPHGAPSRGSSGYHARGWPHHAPSVSQEGKPKATANNKVSTSAIPQYNLASTNVRSYSRPHSAAQPKLHTPSAPFPDATTAYQRDTPSHPTTASTLLQSFQPQAQTHSSSLFPIPLLSESPQADYYPYSAYLYNTTHPHSSNFNQTLLEHQQHSSSPFGPRFLALRHSGIHRYY